MRTLVALVAVMVFAGFAVSQEKIDGKKLIGKWEPATPDPMGSKMVLEFKEKDTFTVTVTINKKTDVVNGTYKLTGNKLEIEMTIKGQVKKETLTITKLTDTELVSKDSKDKEETMKRVK